MKTIEAYAVPAIPTAFETATNLFHFHEQKHHFHRYHVCYAMITFFLRKNEDTTHSHFTLYSLFLPNIIFYRLPLYTNMVLNCGCRYPTNYNITEKMPTNGTAIVVSMSLQRPLKTYIMTIFADRNLER